MLRRIIRQASALSVSDLSSLTFAQMREMLRDVRRRVRRSGWSVVPVVLENHTKDLGDLGPIELLAAEVAAASDLEVITLTELARNLQMGLYPIKTSSGC